ncbi:MAG: 50S ribosomal protein L22 [Candidatus Omnitrophica bacterium]|nr:50S ribosomal protein L22 [Candidatus Omnitrophota bacterium]
MIAKAQGRYIRISPRKTRLVADLIRGKAVGEAFAVLTHVNRRAAQHIERVLKSALSNATRNNKDVTAEELYISKMTIDGGPMLTRYRAATMGRAMVVRHRTSHIIVELEVRKQQRPPAKTAEKSPARKKAVIRKKVTAKSEKTTKKKK